MLLILKILSTKVWQVWIKPILYLNDVIINTWIKIVPLACFMTLIADFADLIYFITPNKIKPNFQRRWRKKSTCSRWRKSETNHHAYNPGFLRHERLPLHPSSSTVDFNYIGILITRTFDISNRQILNPAPWRFEVSVFYCIIISSRLLRVVQLYFHDCTICTLMKYSPEFRIIWNLGMNLAFKTFCPSVSDAWTSFLKARAWIEDSFIP